MVLARVLGEVSNRFLDSFTLDSFYDINVLPAFGDLSRFIAFEAAVGAK